MPTHKNTWYRDGNVATIVGLVIGLVVIFSRNVIMASAGVMLQAVAAIMTSILAGTIVALIQRYI